MKTPEKVSFEELGALRRKYLQEHTESDAKRGYKCKQCGGTIQQITAFMSLHDAIWGDSCAGWGKVQREPIPYCPACEPVPAESGCIHL